MHLYEAMHPVLIQLHISHHTHQTRHITPNTPVFVTRVCHNTTTHHSRKRRRTHTRCRGRPGRQQLFPRARSLLALGLVSARLLQDVRRAAFRFDERPPPNAEALGDRIHVLSTVPLSGAADTVQCPAIAPPAVLGGGGACLVCFAVVGARDHTLGVTGCTRPVKFLENWFIVEEERVRVYVGSEYRPVARSGVSIGVRATV